MLGSEGADIARSDPQRLAAGLALSLPALLGARMEPPEIALGPQIGSGMSGAWGPGYSQDDLEAAQARYGLRFPPDLIALYRDRRPLEGYDWTRDEASIRDMLRWPFDSLLFDVRHGLWAASWGERPVTMADREAVLREQVDQAPKLIPLLGRRYLPEDPAEAGNPVLSVYGSDIIPYGADLTDYFRREFEPLPDEPPAEPRRRIRFWSDFVEMKFDYPPNAF